MLRFPKSQATRCCSTSPARKAVPRSPIIARLVMAPAVVASKAIPISTTTIGCGVASSKTSSGPFATASTVANGPLDVFELATPQPIVVVEIGIAFAATTAGAMTRRAIIGERGTALRTGEIEQLRIFHDVRNRRISKLVHHRPAHQLEFI